MASENTDGEESKRSSLHGDGRAGLAAAARNFASKEHPNTIASIAAAKEAAQKWGWGVLARRQREAEASNGSSSSDKPDISQPMGRGQPLPPPGMPLPRPPRAGMFSFPKKQAAPVPLTPKDGSSSQGTNTPGDSPPKPPALPDRKRRQSHIQNEVPQEDELLVVEAPHDSAPPTPSIDLEHLDEFFGHGEELSNRSQTHVTPTYAPPLPRRRPESREGEDVGDTAELR